MYAQTDPSKQSAPQSPSFAAMLTQIAFFETSQSVLYPDINLDQP
jgi:hypothetical protein